MDGNNQISGRQSAGGRKSMLIIGIILLVISLFLASFVFSYYIIIDPVGTQNSELRNLTRENEQLRNDAQLLQDQLSVVESELESYRRRYGSLSSSGSSDDDEESTGSSSRRSSSGESSSSRASGSSGSSGSSSSSGYDDERTLNMDND